MDRFTIEPVTSWWIIAIIFAIMIVALWAGPNFVKLNQRQQRTLLILRSLVIAMAMIALLRPGIISKIQQKQTAVLAILLDFSRSMRLPQHATGPSRWAAMVDVMEQNQDKFAKIMDQNIEIQFFSFGDQIKPLEEQDGQMVLPDQPSEAETDLGSAIQAIMDSVRDQRLLGINIHSDGRQNVANPEVELSQAAKLLVDTQTPLITVPYGQPAETDQFADIAIENMADQYDIFVKNDLTVSASVTARGFANQEVRSN